MNGSSIECPPKRIEGEDEPFVFSYFSDIVNHPDVKTMVMEISSATINTLTTLTRALSRWKTYRDVWKSDKVREMQSGGDFFPRVKSLQGITT